MLTLLSSIPSYLRPCTYIIAAVLLFCGGWMFNGYRWEARWAEFEASAQKVAVQKAEEARAVETAWRELADLAASDIKGDYDAIEQKYQAALSRIDNLTADLDRLHSERADSADAVPTAPQSAARACKPCTCRSPRPDARGTAQALEIARDCDLLAVRYNSLLNFYNAVKTGSKYE